MLGKRKIRKNVFNLLFGYSFNNEERAVDYYNNAFDNFCCEDDEEDNVRNTFLNVCENVEKLDEIISQHLQDWKINRLSKTTIAILRLSVYEMKYAKLPPAISINEAVELAKQYCEEGASGYINGVLNKIAKSGLLDD